MLSDDAISRLLAGIEEYDKPRGQVYDELFWEVHERVSTTGDAGKIDIAAITIWKRSAQGAWISDLLSEPEKRVRAATRNAFTADDDRAALSALSVLPGYTSQGPLATALLTAFEPTRYAVMDRRAVIALGRLGIDFHEGRGATLRYLATVRQLRDVVSVRRPTVTTRDIDKGLYMVGYTKRQATGSSAHPRDSS